jgi:hypothetical protein
MDEGLNSFVQYLAEQEWERGFPSRRGPAYNIVDYMKGDKAGMVPIMTNSESIKQFGNNSYGKPATALNILRETVMGRELFDMAFKEYCRRWAFKHPQPADFFRTMEDASAVDLDWFWRGWFYTTDNVDLSIENVVFYEVDTKNPELENAKLKEQMSNTRYITDLRNQSEIAQTKVEKNPELGDFYNKYDPLKITESDKKRYEQYYSSLTDEEKQIIGEQKYFYEVTVQNEGGLVMPIILQFDYEDGTNEVQRIPAEIWRMDDKSITKVFVTSKKVKSMQLDPFLETADTEQENNYYPRRILPSKFQLYKQENEKSANPMQQNSGEKKK